MSRGYLGSAMGFLKGKRNPASRARPYRDGSVTFRGRGIENVESCVQNAAPVVLAFSEDVPIQPPERRPSTWDVSACFGLGIV